MPNLSFPLSSTPGSRAGEGQGRLLNSFTEKAGDVVYVRRVPGLTSAVNAIASTPRGLLAVGGALYGAYNGAIIRWTGGGAVSILTGSVPGTDGITWAQNNNSGGPDIVACRESGGAYVISGTLVFGYTAAIDADLPSDVNSVTSGNGYFFFSTPAGEIWASNLNSTSVNALSWATAESRPDGLNRVIWHGGTLYAFGASTIEPWLDVGTSPFPLTRGTSVIPVGLKTTMAVAGDVEGWDHNLYFVAHDGTVRELDGYSTKTVSTPDVERFIAASTTATLTAFVYTFRGHAIWCLTSDAGTWEYNVTTGLWHERASNGLVNWRAKHAVKFGPFWYTGDTQSTSILRVSDSTYAENGAALLYRIESAPLKEYPVRVAVPSLFADFAMGQGGTVSMSQSHDGGATWSTPRDRSLGNAGDYKGPIRWNALGQTSHHGLRVRFDVSSGVDVSFMGASVPNAKGRKP